MSILRTYNLQNPDSATTNIELTADGGAVVSGVSTISQLNVDSGAVVSGVTTTTQLNVGAGGTVITTTVGGNVGIGTDNLTRKLTISKDSETDLSGIELRVVGGISDGNNDGIFFTQSSDGSTSLGSIRCEYKTNGRPGLGFYTRDVGVTTESRKFYIDPDGRVTMPYQPVFQAYGTAGGTYVSGSNYIYPSVVTNIGNHYNTSNGIFTVPVSGTYYFNWSAIGNSGNDVYRYYILVNNSKVSGGSPDWHLRLDTTATSNEYGSGDRSIIITLSQNDTVRINYTADTSTTNYPGGNSNTDNYNTFGGFLIG